MEHEHDAQQRERRADGAAQQPGECLAQQRPADDEPRRAEQHPDHVGVGPAEPDVGLVQDPPPLPRTRVGGGDPTTKIFGIGLGVAVLLDVTLIRMVLGPAVMSLLGARAWWLPGWLDRMLARVDLDAGEPAPSPVERVENVLVTAGSDR